MKLEPTPDAEMREQNHPPYLLWVASTDDDNYDASGPDPLTATCNLVDVLARAVDEALRST